jgi:hypothetical protein
MHPLPRDDVSVRIHNLMTSFTTVLGNTQMIARRAEEGREIDPAALAVVLRMIEREGWNAVKGVREILPLLAPERPCCHVTPCPACANRGSDMSPNG